MTTTLEPVTAPATGDPFDLDIEVLTAPTTAQPRVSPCTLANPRSDTAWNRFLLIA
ncbi:hypothetical protein [Saccharothrix sp. ALI-22-I]|uniref:hypothetical protein n=1 Tax=Saccharothrix sp. ALI-22-I TaxID=1933778 RepID=UPI0015C31C61|nr:hypothetical protein [Saccharothrix sp. ALI-22-I]